MDIKVVCNCQAKFQFEVEPVNGRMPVALQCPVCGADATEIANAAIAEKLAASPPAQVARVARVAVASPAAPVASAPEAAVESSGAAKCPKHLGEIAAAECFVCGKPICHKCMEQFGFLCSSYCKGQAQARKLDVPVFAGQVFEKRGAERRSHQFLVTAVAVVAVALLGAYIWYWFVGSRPKTAFKIETGPSALFLHADWIGDDRFFGVTPLRAVMYNSADGSEAWAVDLPKDEIKGSKFKGDDAWFFDFKPTVKLVSKDIWIALPTRVLRLDGQTGKKKQELMLPMRASDYRSTESHLLAVSRNPTNDSKLLTRISLADGRMESQWTPASSGARRVLSTIKPMAGLGNTSLKNYKPEDEEFSEYNTISYGRDPDFVFAGANVAHITRQLVEERIQVQASAKKKSGPLMIDSGNLRASQGMAAAQELVNQSAPDERIDQSIYSVTIDRYFGGSQPWTGEVSGRPYFFSQKTVDFLVAGTTLIVFNKNNQKIWEAKLTYPISWNFIDGEDESGPALEMGNRLLFFDQGILTAFDLKKGEAQWRVNSVGISRLTPDSSGNLYVSSTTGSPENIRYTKQVKFSEKIYPMMVKVELKTGKVLWQSPRVGEDCLVSGDYVYTSYGQVSGIDTMSIAMGSDKSAPVHWRLYRLDSKSGKDQWEWYHPGAPDGLHPRQKKILLQFKEELQLLKFL